MVQQKTLKIPADTFYEALDTSQSLEILPSSSLSCCWPANGLLKLFFRLLIYVAVIYLLSTSIVTHYLLKSNWHFYLKLPAIPISFMHRKYSCAPAIQFSYLVALKSFSCCANLLNLTTYLGWRSSTYAGSLYCELHRKVIIIVPLPVVLFFEIWQISFSR